jgi:hypothetical protein
MIKKIGNDNNNTKWKKKLFPIRIDKNILLELIGDNVTCNLSYKNELTRQHS